MDRRTRRDSAHCDPLTPLKQHTSPVTCKIQPSVRSSHPKAVSSLSAAFAYTWGGEVLFSFE